jgi:ribosomal-protein-alanine N-acetyltransferase
MEWDLGDFKIRPYRLGDEESIAKHANNPKVALNLRDTFPNPYTLEDAKRWIQMCVAEGLNKTNWGIEVNGECAGGIGLVLMQDVHRLTAEIGYWLGEEHWNKGIVTRAAGVITDHGLNDLGLIRIYTGIYERNPASMKVLEKNGYVKEGIERRSIIKGDVIMDAHVYAKVKE